MTWSYVPVETKKDEIRFLIGDININAPILQDEEIDYTLARFVPAGTSPENITQGMVTAAACLCAEAAYTRLGQLCDESVGSVSISFSQLYKNYQSVLNNLRRMSAIYNISMFSGGVFRADSTSNRKDKSIVQPLFHRNMLEGARHVNRQDLPEECEQFDAGD